MSFQTEHVSSEYMYVVALALKPVMLLVSF